MNGPGSATTEQCEAAPARDDQFKYSVTGQVIVRFKDGEGTHDVFHNFLPGARSLKAANEIFKKDHSKEIATKAVLAAIKEKEERKHGHVGSGLDPREAIYKTDIIESVLLHNVKVHMELTQIDDMEFDTEWAESYLNTEMRFIKQQKAIQAELELTEQIKNGVIKAMMKGKVFGKKK